MNDDVTQLDTTFAALRAATVAYVKPDGIEKARATVRRRNRARAVALAALAVAVLGLPVAIYAAVAPNSVPVPGATPSPEPTTSGSPTATPSSPAPPTTPALVPKVEQSCEKPSTSVAPPGGIALTELCDATLTIPAWKDAPRCASDSVRFTDGARFIVASTFVNLGSSRLVSDTDLAYADIDVDGDYETLLLLSCGGETWISTVIALQRTSDGEIETLGTVVATNADIRRLIAVNGRVDGTVEVEVADWNGGLGDDGSLAQRQWRSYAWDGGRFAQVGGPTAFAPNPKVTDFAVTSTGLAFSAAKDGERTGTVSVTVRNEGRSAAAYSVVLQVPDYAELSPTTGCTTETSAQPVVAITCTADELRSGGTRTLTLTFRAAADADEVEVDLLPAATVRIADGYGDDDHSNDWADFSITFA